MQSSELTIQALDSKHINSESHSAQQAWQEDLYHSTIGGKMGSAQGSSDINMVGRAGPAEFSNNKILTDVTFVDSEKHLPRIRHGQMIEIGMPSKEEQDGLPEFQKRPTGSDKEGWGYITGKAKELLGLGDTMHDRVKELVLAGMSPEQRQKYLKEEKDWKDSMGYGPYDPEMANLKNHPQGPMHDLVNKLTLAAEKDMAAEAKKGMSRMDALNAERGIINGENNPQVETYEQRLLSLLQKYEAKGEIPPPQFEKRNLKSVRT